MDNSQTEKASWATFLPDKPFVNCHTHIFTGKHVPPFLRRKFLYNKIHGALFKEEEGEEPKQNI